MEQIYYGSVFSDEFSLPKYTEIFFSNKNFNVENSRLLIYRLIHSRLFRVCMHIFLGDDIPILNFFIYTLSCARIR